jgi:hypothetical protein
MILTLFFNKKYRILTLYININSQKKKRRKSLDTNMEEIGTIKFLFPHHPSPIGPMERALVQLIICQTFVQSRGQKKGGYCTKFMSCSSMSSMSSI